MSLINRRKFIGYSAIISSSILGTTTISLNSCKKDTNNQLDAEVFVIGSGFGGSVVALRLAEKGIKTTLFEMGKSFPFASNFNTFSPTLPPDKRSTWLQEKTELPFGINLSWRGKYVGVLNKVSYPNMSVYRNICLGGGSISNGGVLLEPQEQHFNSMMFNDINFATLKQKYFPLVKNKLQASKMPADLFNSEYYKFAQVTKKHAANAGLETSNADSFYNFDIWRKELNNQIPKSALKGELLYGNNNGIKNTLDKNYLSEAVGTGNLKISTLSKVVEITVLPNEKYKITVEHIAENGNILNTKTYTCKYLFICAGSIGTSEILVKAKNTQKLPNLNDFVGKNWGTNGNTFAMRGNINEPTGNMHSSPPTLSVLDYNNTFAPIAAMQDIFPLGLDLRLLLMVGLPYIENRGEFKYNEITQKVELIWDSNGNNQGVLAMKNLMEKLNNANGGNIDTTFISSGISKNFTYHPLGGATLGQASDNFGRLKGYKNLYAIDGSMLPGNCALVNPSLTIAALAERNIETILAEDFS